MAKVFTNSNEITNYSTLKECLVWELAQQFGLAVPEAFCIDGFRSGFSQDLPDEHKGRYIEARRRNSMVFGSAFLGDAVMVPASPPRWQKEEGAYWARLFVFDCLVHNTDRRVDKPNLLRSGGRYFCIDHEKALAFAQGTNVGVISANVDRRLEEMRSLQNLNTLTTRHLALPFIKKHRRKVLPLIEEQAELVDHLDLGRLQTLSNFIGWKGVNQAPFGSIERYLNELRSDSNILISAAVASIAAT